MALYNYGDGVSQERVNWQWCVMRVVNWQREETKENKSFGEHMQMLHETLVTTN
jgi:hypothetical protein